jgi:hypothetical protein
MSYAVERLRLGAFDVLRGCHAAFHEHALQFIEIAGRERLVHPQFVYDDVIQVLTQERTRFGNKLRLIRTDREAGQVEAGFASHQVFEIRVDRLALALVDEMHERAQASAHRSSIVTVTSCHHSSLCTSWINAICSRTIGMAAFAYF